VFLAGVLCASAGVGGGGLFIAIFVLTIQMSTHLAFQLSFITVFGISCGSFIVLVQQRHPMADRPLIDHLLCLLLEPLTLAGSLFGVFLNSTLCNESQKKGSFGNLLSRLRCRLVNLGHLIMLSCCHVSVFLTNDEQWQACQRACVTFLMCMKRTQLVARDVSLRIARSFLWPSRHQPCVWRIQHYVFSWDHLTTQKEFSLFLLQVVGKLGCFFCPRQQAWIDSKGMVESDKLLSSMMLCNGDRILLPLPLKVLKVHLKFTGTIHTMRFDSQITVKELIQVVVEKAQLNDSLPNRFYLETNNCVLVEDFFIVELPEYSEVMMGYCSAATTD